MAFLRSTFAFLLDTRGVCHLCAPATLCGFNASAPNLTSLFMANRSSPLPLSRLLYGVDTEEVETSVSFFRLMQQALALRALAVLCAIGSWALGSAAGDRPSVLPFFRPITLAEVLAAVPPQTKPTHEQTNSELTRQPKQRWQVFSTLTVVVVDRS